MDEVKFNCGWVASWKEMDWIECELDDKLVLLMGKVARRLEESR